jgi:hypothetical protein
MTPPDTIREGQMDPQIVLIGDAEEGVSPRREEGVSPRRVVSGNWPPGGRDEGNEWFAI